ncbi:HAAS signaling domain-containing protein [Streptomyces sp. NPDC088090]|uniref:HAAS signaling domain-containing protein n=1 Tax=Streptomyces sp. NPDC088090 TaxID=3365822 RepID=UPI00384A87A7
MKTPADPVRDYLSAVEREVSTLPADRRQELLADLAEHIAVTRAEHPGATDREVLAELGDPRVIAATALAEAGGGPAAAWGRPREEPARRGKVHPLVPLLLLTVPFVLGTLSTAFLTDSSVPQLVVGLVRIVGAVLLCTSAFWTPVQKIVGVVLTIVLSTVANLLWEETTVAPAGDTPALVANLVTLAVLAASAAWLWRVRRRV